jgi:hypothetical protein
MRVLVQVAHVFLLHFLRCTSSHSLRIHWCGLRAGYPHCAHTIM